MKVGSEHKTMFKLWHILEEDMPLCGEMAGDNQVRETTDTEIELWEGVSDKTKGKHQHCKSCLAKLLEIEIEITKSGQLRRYGDSVLHATITDKAKQMRSREEILALYNRIGRQRVFTKDDEESKENPFLMMLNSLRNDGHTVWRLEAVAAYAD